MSDRHVLKIEEKRAYRVPSRTGKPRKMGWHFPVGENSENFEQIGKVGENHTKNWKSQGISARFVIYFLVIFK